MDSIAAGYNREGFYRIKCNCSHDFTARTDICPRSPDFQNIDFPNGYTYNNPTNTNE